MAGTSTLQPAGQRQGGSAMIVQLSMEFLGLGLAVLVAGINEQVGKIMVIFMIGLLLVMLIAQADLVAGVGRVFNEYLGNPYDIKGK